MEAVVIAVNIVGILVLALAALAILVLALVPILLITIRSIRDTRNTRSITVVDTAMDEDVDTVIAGDAVEAVDTSVLTEKRIFPIEDYP